MVNRGARLAWRGGLWPVAIVLFALFLSPALAGKKADLPPLSVGAVVAGQESDRKKAAAFMHDDMAFPPFPVRARDAGWTPRGLGGAGGTYCPSFSPFHPGLALLGTDMGAAFRSEDDGRHWELIHFRNGLRFMQFAAQPAYFPDRIYWNRGKSPVLRASTDQGLNWPALSVSPWRKAEILALAALPGTPDVLLVGTAEDLWRTDDHAATWTKVLAGRVGELLVLGDTVYGVNQLDRLVRSRDQGRSWEDMPGLPPGIEIMGLTGGLDDGGSVLVLSAKPLGLLRSVDQGRTWETVKRPYQDETVLRMAPTQRAVVFAAQTRGVTNQQVLRSVDGGATWAPVFRMARPGQPEGAGTNVRRSWVQHRLQWWYYITRKGLAVNPRAPDTLLLTTQGDIYRSEDGGDSWTQTMTEHREAGSDVVSNRSVGLEVTSAWGYHFDPHDATRHYISYTDIGFARSEDKGQSWIWGAKGSPWVNTFYDVSLDPDVPGRLFAAASRLHDIPYDTSLRVTHGNYGLHMNGGVVVSTDFGATWTVPYGKGSLPRQVCTTVAVDPASPVESRVLYAGIFGEGDDDQAGVYKSTDGGRSWERKSDGLGHFDASSGLRNLHIYRLRLHPGTGELYCLITGLRGPTRETMYNIPGGLWKSSDGGETWRELSAGQDLAWYATSFCFDPRDDNVIYVTAGSPPGRWRQGGVFKTRDGGRSWTRILDDELAVRTAGGLRPSENMMCVAVHPDDSALVYVGTTTHGLLYSEDGGTSWKAYAAFPATPVQSISFNPGDHGRMVVTTFGSGAWEGPHLPRP